MIKIIRPRLVTFDVTGTLLMTQLDKHYAEIGLKYGLPVNSEQLVHSFKSNFEKLAREHPIYGRHTGLGWKNWWKIIVYNIFKDQHQNVSDSTLNKVADNLIEYYGTSKCWHSYSNATDLLEYLQKKGIILGVISNFDERLEKILIDTKLRPYFSFVLTSYKLGLEKPNPLIFNEAIRLSNRCCKTNFITPLHSIHVGDMIDNDYLAAKAAGWNAFLMVHEGHQMDIDKYDKDMAKCIFRSLKELQLHFEVLLNQE